MTIYEVFYIDYEHVDGNIYLDYCDSPTDKGNDVFIKLWNEREIL